MVTLEGSSDRFRLLYDVKGRFVLHRIDENEAQYKLCKVVKRQLSSKKIPFIVTHDARTIRFPDPTVKVNDTVKVDLKTNKVIGHVKFEVGNLCFITKCGGSRIRHASEQRVHHRRGKPAHGVSA